MHGPLNVKGGDCCEVNVLLSKFWERKTEYMTGLVLESTQDLPPATPLILLAHVFPTLRKTVQNV